ncbi:MAG: hypothetical protein PWP67_900 [Clostridium butyricum]|nr:hypothetical protein [Clostridium butyricum]
MYNKRIFKSTIEYIKYKLMREVMKMDKLNLFQETIGFSIVKDNKILKTDEVNYIRDYFSNDGYTGYSLVPDGTGILLYNSENLNDTFVYNSELIQLNKPNIVLDKNTIKIQLSRLFEIMNRINVMIKNYGIKLIGVSKVNESDNKIYSYCIKDEFLSNIRNNDINLNGIGLRLSYQLGNFVINHYIEPYFNDKDFIYSIIDANTNYQKPIDITFDFVYNDFIKIIDQYKKGFKFFK